MDTGDELARAIERAMAELRARMGRKSQKRKKLKKIGRPAKTGPSAGCGTGAGGFKAGNNCATEDGRPQMPKAFSQGSKSPTAASLPATKEALVAKAAALKAMAKDAKISSARKKSAIRKKAKEEKVAAESKAAADAKAAKKKALLQKLRIAKANDKLKVAGTPKSVKEQLAEAKAQMKEKVADASKKLTVASTPKSIKQEIADLKAKKASESLAVVGTPRTIKEELDSLKQRLAASGKPPSQPPPPPPDAQPIKIGELLKKTKNQTTPSDQKKIDEDKATLFGSHLEHAWKFKYDVQSDKLKSQQKVSISMEAAKRLDKMGIKEEDIGDDVLEVFGAGYYHGKTYTSQNNIPDGYKRRYALSAGMVDSWASTSGDGVAASVGMQYAIKEEFKLPKTYTKSLNASTKKSDAKWNSSMAIVRDSKPVRAVLRAHYDATQARLKALGVKELTVARGYESSHKVDPLGEQNVSLQPASSFTLTKNTAEMFAGSGSKTRLMVATVPASRVLSLCSTGFGCVHETELTVLGGILKARVRRKASEW